MEDIIADYENKLVDEEEKAIKNMEEKKKLQQGIQDLEERWVLIWNFFYFSHFV